MDYRLTTDNFKTYLLSKGFASKSVEIRMWEFKDYAAWMQKERMEPEEVRYNDLLLYMKSCQRKGKTQRSIQHYMGTVRHFYNHLIDDEKITNNPTSNIQIKGVKRKVLYPILETHELNRLYQAHKMETATQRRNKVMIGLMVYQGLKTEELSRLEVKDVDLRAGKVQVSGSRKSNERTLQLEAHQVMELYDYVLKGREEIAAKKAKSRKEKEGAITQLFISDGGNAVNMKSLMSQLMTQLKKINPTIQNARQLRASVITKWLKMHNLREVQYLAGHRYISSTEQYLANEMEGLIEEVQQYHPLG